MPSKHEVNCVVFIKKYVKFRQFPCLSQMHKSANNINVTKMMHQKFSDRKIFTHLYLHHSVHYIQCLAISCQYLGNQISRKPYLQDTISPGNHISRKPYLQKTISPENHISRKPYLQETLSLGNHISKQPYLQATISLIFFQSKMPKIIFVCEKRQAFL